MASNSDSNAEHISETDYFDQPVLHDIYDICLISSKEDRSEKNKFADILKKFVRLADGGPPKICCVDDDTSSDKSITGAGGAFEHVDQAFKNSSFIFFFLTKNYDNWKKGKFFKDASLNDAILNDEKKWSIVPIIAEPGLKPDFGFRGIKGIDVPTLLKRTSLEDVNIAELKVEQVDSSVLEGISRMLNTKINDRKAQKVQRDKQEAKEQDAEKRRQEMQKIENSFIQKQTIIDKTVATRANFSIANCPATTVQSNTSNNRIYSHEQVLEMMQEIMNRPVIINIHNTSSEVPSIPSDNVEYLVEEVSESNTNPDISLRQQKNDNSIVQERSGEVHTEQRLGIAISKKNEVTDQSGTTVSIRLDSEAKLKQVSSNPSPIPTSPVKKKPVGCVKPVQSSQMTSLASPNTVVKSGTTQVKEIDHGHGDNDTLPKLYAGEQTVDDETERKFVVHSSSTAEQLQSYDEDETDLKHTMVTPLVKKHVKAKFPEQVENFENPSDDETSLKRTRVNFTHNPEEANFPMGGSGAILSTSRENLLHQENSICDANDLVENVSGNNRGVITGKDNSLERSLSPRGDNSNNDSGLGDRSAGMSQETASTHSYLEALLKVNHGEINQRLALESSAGNQDKTEDGSPKRVLDSGISSFATSHTDQSSSKFSSSNNAWLRQSDKQQDVISPSTGEIALPSFSNDQLSQSDGQQLVASRFGTGETALPSFSNDQLSQSDGQHVASRFAALPPSNTLQENVAQHPAATTRVVQVRYNVDTQEHHTPRGLVSLPAMELTVLNGTGPNASRGASNYNSLTSNTEATSGMHQSPIHRDNNQSGQESRKPKKCVLM